MLAHAHNPKQGIQSLRRSVVYDYMTIMSARIRLPLESDGALVRVYYLGFRLSPPPLDPCPRKMFYRLTLLEHGCMGPARMSSLCWFDFNTSTPSISVALFRIDSSSLETSAMSTNSQTHIAYD